MKRNKFSLMFLAIIVLSLVTGKAATAKGIFAGTESENPKIEINKSNIL